MRPSRGQQRGSQPADLGLARPPPMPPAAPAPPQPAPPLPPSSAPLPPAPPFLAAVSSQSSAPAHAAATTVTRQYTSTYAPADALAFLQRSQTASGGLGSGAIGGATALAQWAEWGSQAAHFRAEPSVLRCHRLTITYYSRRGGPAPLAERRHPRCRCNRIVFCCAAACVSLPLVSGALGQVGRESGASPLRAILASAQSPLLPRRRRRHHSPRFRLALLPLPLPLRERAFPGPLCLTLPRVRRLHRHRRPQARDRGRCGPGQGRCVRGRCRCGCPGRRPSGGAGGAFDGLSASGGADAAQSDIQTLAAAAAAAAATAAAGTLPFASAPSPGQQLLPVPMAALARGPPELPGPRRAPCRIVQACGCGLCCGVSGGGRGRSRSLCRTLLTQACCWSGPPRLWPCQPTPPPPPQLPLLLLRLACRRDSTWSPSIGHPPSGCRGRRAGWG